MSGRRAQSKKLLETPGLRYNHAKMTFIMTRFVTIFYPRAVELSYYSSWLLVKALG